MKKILLLGAALWWSVSVNAQNTTFEVPQNVVLGKAADYASYEKDVAAADRWLVETPLNEQAEKRREVNAFLVQWLAGTPKVNITMYTFLLDAEKINKGMMVLYMAGCARYAIEKSDYTNTRAQQKAALQDMITVYQSGKGIRKDKTMEKLIRADKAGKLDTWINENMPLN